MPRCARTDCGRWRPRLLMRAARIGMRVDGAWFCCAACVAADAAVRLRMRGGRAGDAGRPISLRLGSMLLHMGAISAAQLEDALHAQKRTGRRLGAELQRRGLVDRAAVVRALAAQAGVSYLEAVDPSCVRSAPGGLCPEEVRALGLVPLRTVEEQRTMVVACAAPVPTAALAALREITGYTPVAYLVSDEDAAALAAAYGADRPPASPSVRAQWVDDVHDAAQRIAAAAASDREITVSEAHVSPFTWIRVAGRHGIEAMLLAADGMMGKEGAPWPAGTTRR